MTALIFLAEFLVSFAFYIIFLVNVLSPTDLFYIVCGGGTKYLLVCTAL